MEKTVAAHVRFYINMINGIYKNKMDLIICCEVSLTSLLRPLNENPMWSCVYKW
jgi:hypothetical protein